MDIIKGITAVDLGLQIKDNLILADFHIGFDEALNKQGVLVPRFQFNDIAAKLESVLGSGKFGTIIVNGDLKHEFGTISRTEWKQTLDLLDLLSEHCSKIVLIKGNHDTILEPIAQKRNIEIVDEFVIGDVYVCHGNKIPETEAFRKAKTVIIAHEHPAVTLRTPLRAERYKCFLLGKYRRKSLIVMPSFNLVTEGTDILKERLLSPFLMEISEFKVFVVGDKAYDFGKVKKFAVE